jgi:FliI/YscN family ATPase
LHPNEFPLTYAHADGWIRRGVVTAVTDRSISVRVPGLTHGAAVFVARPPLAPLAAEVVSVSSGVGECALLGAAQGVSAGAVAMSALARVGAFVGDALLGSVTDAWGRCEAARNAKAIGSDPVPLSIGERAPVRRLLRTGVAAIDALVSLGYGQRAALFAGAGVGKTTLLRRIVERADVDARVVALVGERGREAAEIVAEFRHGGRWKTTTVVCATAEAPAAQRLAAARTATAQAEALAAGGRDVLLVVDSLTRVATAWREIALAGGEAPAHRGHPPSLAGMLARLVERAGARQEGTITGLYTVLVDGDDVREPVTDSLRALLDGHVVLSRSLAESGYFPAIDVLASMSRLMPNVAAQDHSADAAEVRRAMGALARAEDLFAIGAYRPGGDVRLDAAVSAREDIERLVFDDSGDRQPQDPVEALAEIAARLRAAR